MIVIGRKRVAVAALSAAALLALPGVASAHTADLNANCKSWYASAKYHPEGAVATVKVDGSVVSSFTFGPDDPGGEEGEVFIDSGSLDSTANHVVQFTVTNSPQPYEETINTEACVTTTTVVQTTVPVATSTTQPPVETTTTTATSTTTTTTSAASTTTQPEENTTTSVDRPTESTNPSESSVPEETESSEPTDTTATPTETTTSSELPATGGAVTTTFVVGLACVSIGAIILYFRRRFP